MNARDIVERAYGDGLDLSIVGNDLHAVATLAPPAPELLDALKAHKAEILSLLRSCPAYTHDEQRDLSDWYCGQSRTDRLRMRRRADALSNEDGIPHHVAVCLAIESERASATEGIRNE
jgi:hypothetical protein